MSKPLRAADDIQAGDWVMSPDGKTVYEANGNHSGSGCLRILMPGDVVPVGAVLVRWQPGLMLHMYNVTITQAFEIERESDYRYALKSLPELRVVPYEVRNEYADLRAARSSVNQSIKSLIDSQSSAPSDAMFDHMFDHSIGSCLATRTEIESRTGALAVEWPELQEDA